MYKLTAKQSKFARLFFETGNASKAYRDSYDAAKMTDASVGNAAYQLLQNDEVAAYVEDMRESAEYASQLSTAWLIKQHMQIATADINELIESRRVNCRHCHGIDHEYQWVDEKEWANELATVVDWNARREANNAKRPDGAMPCKPLPTLDGGVGFWGTREPHPECPSCFGNGEQQVHIKDTRKLTGAAKLVYAGVKQTANGIEVKLRNQDASLDWLARYLGLDKKSLEISGPNGGPIGTVSLSAEELNDDQLAAIVAQDASDDQSE